MHLSPALTLVAMSIPVWIAVAAVCWPSGRDEPTEQAGPKCPCPGECGRPPGQHNPPFIPRQQDRRPS